MVIEFMERNKLSHGIDEYNLEGLEPFISHAYKHLYGNSELPVFFHSQDGHTHIDFAFSDYLLEELLDPKNNYRKSQIEKAYEVAIKYGFRGFSQGEQNGVFFQRKQDDKLKRATDRFSRLYWDEIESFFGIDDDIKQVKIVSHNPRGERIVGVYSTRNKKMMFLNFAKY